MIVTGYIFDNNMRPVSGVQITELYSFGGVANSVFTNSAGAFTMVVSSVASQLRIVRAGYEVKTVSANNFSYTELIPSDELPEASVQNGYQKTDNSLLYIIAALAAGVIATKVLVKKPRKVTV